MEGLPVVHGRLFIFFNNKVVIKIIDINLLICKPFHYNETCKGLQTYNKGSVIFD